MTRKLVPVPCHEDWDKLTPEQRGHFCTVCDTKVWDLSALTKAQAEAFLQARRGEDLCVSYREHENGSVVHRESPIVPLSRLARRLPAAAGLSLMLACTPTGDAPASQDAKSEASPTPAQPEAKPDAKPEAKPESKPDAEATPPATDPAPGAPDTQPAPLAEERRIKGKWADEPPPPPPPAEPAPPIRKGKVAPAVDPEPVEPGSLAPDGS